MDNLGKSMKRLSVIMPNFNHGHMLGRSLGAIAAQVGADDEVIVLDDASTDNSRDIIAEFSSRHPNFRFLFNPVNQGVVATANRGLELVRGEYVYFAGADDYILPGFFDALCAAASRHPHAGIITSDPAYERDGSGIMEAHPLPLGCEERYLGPVAMLEAQRFLNASFHIPGHASLLRRDAVIEAGGLRGELRWFSDWFMSFVIAFRSGLVYVPQSFAVMSINSSTYSAKGRASWSDQRAVFAALAVLLSDKSYSDVRELLVQSGVISQLHPYLLRAALQNPGVRSLIRPVTVRSAMHLALYNAGIRRFIPGWVLSMRRSYKDARAARAVSSF